MTNELMIQTNGAMVDQRIEFSPAQVELIKRTICKGANNDELNLFLLQCKRTGLCPFSKQIFAVSRYDKKAGKNVFAFQVSIDGLRLIAARTGKYAGQLGPFWCGKDGKWVDVWISEEKPAAAKVGVLRSDFKEPIFAVATWNSYFQEFKDKDGGGKVPSQFWQKMGDVMLAKCAESLALRKAFPHELAATYSNSEQNIQPPHQVTAAMPEYDDYEWAEILSADMSWMRDEKVPFKNALGQTWSELAEENAAALNSKGEKIKGRQYLHMLESWKEGKSEIRIKARIALEEGKTKQAVQEAEQAEAEAQTAQQNQ